MLPSFPLQVDKLEESETTREEEKKEEEYKPVVMGKLRKVQLAFKKKPELLMTMVMTRF